MNVICKQYKSFVFFANEYEIDEDIFLHAKDYICLNKRRNYDSLYWEAFSNYATKCCMVLDFKKKKGFKQTVRIGEAVCKNEIVNFLKDTKQFPGNCNCGSTYMQFNPLKYNKKWIYTMESLGL